MSGFFTSLGQAVLAVVLSFLVLTVVVSFPRLDPTAPVVALPDYRNISVEVRGDLSRPNCIIWLHGVISSRYEALAVDEGILKELDAYVLSFDRPGYGESTVHRGRDYVSAAEDIAAVADSFGVGKFYLVGVSAGGTYAWAAASMLSARVRGVLLLSSAGPRAILKGEAAERADLLLEGKPERHLIKALKNPWPRVAFMWFTETYVGGRALFALWLESLAKTTLARMAEVDAKCIMRSKRTEYNLKIIPESLKQGIATPVIQDLVLLSQPWPFNISAIPDQLASAIHIWHGTGDKQVHSDYALAFKEAVPAASMRIIEDGGHFAFWVCNQELQREALQQLLASGLPA